MARVLALGRIGIGTVLLIAPGLIGHRLGAPMTKRIVALTRVMAIRDVVIGIGTFQALNDGSPAVPWVRAAATADAVDAVAMVMAADEIGARAALAGSAIASTSAVLGFRAATELSD